MAAPFSYSVTEIQVASEVSKHVVAALLEKLGSYQRQLPEHEASIIMDEAHVAAVLAFMAGDLIRELGFSGELLQLASAIQATTNDLLS